MWMVATTHQSDRSARRWQHLRFALGMTQMGGAVVSLTLLLNDGVTTAGLVAVVVTSMMTTISVLLFGSGRGRGGQRYPNS